MPFNRLEEIKLKRYSNYINHKMIKERPKIQEPETKSIQAAAMKGRVYEGSSVIRYFFAHGLLFFLFLFFLSNFRAADRIFGIFRPAMVNLLPLSILLFILYIWRRKGINFPQKLSRKIIYTL